MKMYLDESQTAKLIELGIEKPNNTQYVQRAKARNLHSPFIEFGEPEFEGSYSIGELIEILPKIIETEIWWGDEKGKIGVWGLRIDTEGVEYMWTITYERDNSANLGVVGAGEELIDALFEMVIKLKEEEVI